MAELGTCSSHSHFLGKPPCWLLPAAASANPGWARKSRSSALVYSVMYALFATFCARRFTSFRAQAATAAPVHCCNDPTKGNVIQIRYSRQYKHETSTPYPWHDCKCLELDHCIIMQ
eukprot:scaffold285552_cov23-Tisochrysis_lutea.AAC.1